jgi:hypothetical protein
MAFPKSQKNNLPDRAARPLGRFEKNQLTKPPAGKNIKPEFACLHPIRRPLSVSKDFQVVMHKWHIRNLVAANRGGGPDGFWRPINASPRRFVA